MKTPLFWLWLASLEGAHIRLLDCWPDEEPLALEELKKAGVLSEEKLTLLSRAYRTDWAAKQYEALLSFGGRLLTPADEDYPRALFDLGEPPCALYLKGHLPFVPTAAMVGTRRCSSYGMSVAHGLGEAVARAGGAVISGGARGVDSHAHSGALDGGGATVAVLATGLDRPWPTEHLDLFRKMVECGGGLITEYPLGTPGQRWRFPRRNRLIAALSEAVVVVESPYKGGSMRTAEFACEMGRPLWAVPGRIDEGVCAGSNRLIYDGATPLIDLADFAARLTGAVQVGLFEAAPEGEAEAKLLQAISYQSDMTADALAVATGLSAGDVLVALGGLELKGLVSAVGSRWRRKG